MAIPICFPFSFAIFNICVVSLFIIFMIEAWRDKAWPQISKIDILILAYFLISCVSIINTRYWVMSVEGVGKLLRYLASFYIATKMIRSKNDLKLLSLAIFTGCLVAAAGGLIQWWLGVDPLRQRTPIVSLGGMIRIRSSFDNPNGLMIYLSLVIPFIYAAVRFGKAQFRWGWVILIMGAAAMALTFSRAGFLALAASGIFFLFMKKDKLVALGFALSIVAVFLVLPSQIRDWFQGFESWTNFFGDSSRSMHHQTAWNMIREHPFIGVGINSFDVTYHLFKPVGDPTTRWSAHQSYLQMIAETGWIGFSFFVAVISFSVGRIVFAYRSLKDALLQSFLLGALGSLVAFFVVCFYESCLWQPRNTYMFWCFLGFVVAAAECILNGEGRLGDT